MLHLKKLPTLLCGSVLRFNDRYMKWSPQGNTLHDHGIEAAISSAIAGDLFKKNPRSFIALETKFRTIKKEAKSSSKKPVGGERADVVYYNERKEPVGVIEVKRWADSQKVMPDIERIVSLLSAYGPAYRGSLRWGAVVLFGTVWAGKKKDNGRLDNFIAILEKKVFAYLKKKHSHANYRLTPFLKHKALPKPLPRHDGVLKACEAVCLMIEVIH